MNRFYLFPPEASSGAAQVDWLYFGLTAMMLFFCLVVFVPIIYFCIRYRRGSGAGRSNPSSGNNLLESGWTLFPLVVSLGFFSWGAVVYYHLSGHRETPLKCRWWPSSGCGSWSMPRVKKRLMSYTSRLGRP